MKTITKVLLTGLTAFALTACGSSSDGASAQDKAIDKISNYAQNGGEVPTLQDYIDAGVTGITNVDEINAYILGLTKEDVDTTEEIQAKANELGVELTGNLPPIARAGAVPTTVTEGETVQFSSNRSVDTDGTIVSYSWSEGEVGLANVPSFSKSDFSVGTHTITLTVTDNGGATDYDTITIIVEPEPEPEAEPTSTVVTAQEQCLATAGYGTVTLDNGQVWLDRDLGAPAIGELGTVYNSYEDVVTACPCDFGIPTSTDFLTMDQTNTLLVFPDGNRRYWTLAEGIWQTKFTTINNGAHSGHSWSSGVYSSPAYVRCIDPSTSTPEVAM